MRRYDVAVLGVGGLGVACLAYLARRGLSVVGLDNTTAAGPLASSRSTRGFRQAYFVDDRYVQWAKNALVLWRALEQRSGKQVLNMTGALQIGPPQHPAVAGVRDSCQRNNLGCSVLTPAEAGERFPALHCPHDFIAVLEEEAGILDAERCNAIYLAEARAAGAELLEGAEVRSLAEQPDGMVVDTSEDGALLASRVVISCGAGSAAVLGRMQGTAWQAPLEVQEQAELYFDPQGAHLGSDQLPPLSWLAEDGPYSIIPDVFGEGLKVFRQHPPVPDGCDPQLRAFMAEAVPEAAQLRCTEHFINREAVTPDKSPLLGPHPETERVVLATGLSGHGFKFVPVFAEAIGRLICDGDDLLPDLFSPARPR